MLSVDSPRRARQCADELDPRPPSPILSDVDDGATVACNVLENGIALASAFLLDRHGRVRRVYLGATPSERPSTDQLPGQVTAVADPG